MGRQAITTSIRLNPRSYQLVRELAYHRARQQERVRISASAVIQQLLDDQEEALRDEVARLSRHR